MKQIKVKYFEGATKLEKIALGNWIDVYSRVDIALPKNSAAMIPLGFAMELPEGYEAYLAPRSSTFKKWGVIQTNSFGIIDETYKGDNDEWMMPVYCLQPRDVSGDFGMPVTIIKKGDKIGQFRIVKAMEDIEFVEVDHLDNPDRGGFGSTGSTK